MSTHPLTTADAAIAAINARLATKPLTTETGDICRELPDAEELKSKYEELDKNINRNADKYAAQLTGAANTWDTLVPLLDQMQSFLSQRGERRALMDGLDIPTWSDWFKNFRPRLKDVTLRTIQRKIAEYRGKKPVKKNTRQNYDAVDIMHLEKVAKAAEGLAAADPDNAEYDPIREAIASKPDGGLAAVEGHQIKTPVHTQINQLALQLANSVLSYKGVPEPCGMLAQQIVDLMTPQSSPPPAPAVEVEQQEAPTVDEFAKSLVVGKEYELHLVKGWRKVVYKGFLRLKYAFEQPDNPNDDYKYVKTADLTRRVRQLSVLPTEPQESV